MSYSVNVTLSISVTGNGRNDSQTYTVASTTSPGLREPFLVVNGRGSVTVPVGATMAVIVPPTSSSVVKTWDASGTEGGPIGMTTPTWITLPAGTTALWIGGDGTEAIEVFIL